ncbi:MAG: hypothetical protein NHB14_25010 [Desulfosporosinus sp.]|nr:hypothetical protein [Desulfosporosinus sp.]
MLANAIEFGWRLKEVM